MYINYQGGETYSFSPLHQSCYRKNCTLQNILYKNYVKMCSRDL